MMRNVGNKGHVRPIRRNKAKYIAIIGVGNVLFLHDTYFEGYTMCTKVWCLVRIEWNSTETHLIIDAVRIVHIHNS